MISPEVLRRYPFFGSINGDHIKNLAMAADLVQYQDEEIILEEGTPATAVYFLIDGCVDLYYTVEKNFHSHLRREVPVSQISPGEAFGISTMIEPHILTSTARSSGPSLVIRFDGNTLRELSRSDPELESWMMRQAARTALQRLHSTRIQLAAAWA